MDKLFSIVIPTLNRCDYLKHTLELIIPQVEAHIDDVELVICCNSSKDGTDSYVKELLAERPYIKYKYFEEYVEVGQSLIRSVGESSGEYCVLWGDDDIPFPNFVETILGIIKQNPGVGIIHCNRLIGKDTVFGVRGLKVREDGIDKYEGEKLSLSELIQRFTASLGFISSAIFRTADFLNARDYYNPEHYGYEHLAIMLNGAKGKECYYYSFPLEIQRVPFNRDFSEKWPLYCFAGTPNMMRDFDASGITQGSLERWQNTRNKDLASFVWNMMYASLNKEFNKKHIKELIQYQHSALRRLLAYIIIYCMPKSLFLLLRRRDY